MERRTKQHEKQRQMAFIGGTFKSRPGAGNRVRHTTWKSNAPTQGSSRPAATQAQPRERVHSSGPGTSSRFSANGLNGGRRLCRCERSRFKCVRDRSAAFHFCSHCPSVVAIFRWLPTSAARSRFARRKAAHQTQTPRAPKARRGFHVFFSCRNVYHVSLK